MSEFLYLTTRGWKSGHMHTIEIWYVVHQGCYYLIAEMERRTHWVQNIEQEPAIRFRVADQDFVGVGRIVERAAEPELAATISALMDAKYEWSDGLIVELCAAG